VESARPVLRDILKSEFDGKTITSLTKFYRKQRTIQKLLEEKTLEQIYVEEFHFFSRDDYKGDFRSDSYYNRQLGKFYKKLFNNELTFDQLSTLSPIKLLSLQYRFKNQLS
jgi:hypothetical protein